MILSRPNGADILDIINIKVDGADFSSDRYGDEKMTRTELGKLIHADEMLYPYLCAHLDIKKLKDFDGEE